MVHYDVEVTYTDGTVDRIDVDLDDFNGAFFPWEAEMLLKGETCEGVCGNKFRLFDKKFGR